LRRTQLHEALPGLGRRLHRLTPRGDHTALPTVDLIAVDLDDTWLGRRLLGTSQHGLDPGQQLARRERFGDVVVGAHLQAEDLVDLGVACGQHDDGRLGELPDTTTRLHPVDPWQVEIEQDRRHGSETQALHCLLTGEGVEESITVALEEGAQHVCNGVVVLDEQNRLRVG
jgi:hypothetical protein